MTQNVQHSFSPRNCVTLFGASFPEISAGHEKSVLLTNYVEIPVEHFLGANRESVF